MAAAMTACQRSGSVSTPDGKVTYQEKGKDSGSLTVTGKDGQKATLDFGGAGKVPDDYPKDVPVYKNAKVMMSTSVAEKNGRSLVLESSDDTAKIAAFYKKELESGGWKIESTVAAGEMNMVTATKDNRQAMIQIIGGEDKRSINQVLSDK